MLGMPTTEVGTAVAPKVWNELISQPDGVLIDTRSPRDFHGD